jgi:flagellar basal body-associated protein FliL
MQIITSVIIGIVIVLLAKAIISFTYYIVTGKKGGLPNLNGNTPTSEENKAYTPEATQTPNLDPTFFPSQ